MPDPKLTDIAAALRRASPGRVPERIEVLDKGMPLYVVAGGKYIPLPDDIARHVIGFAMVMDYFDGYSISRCPNLSGWEVRLDFDEMADGGIAWEWDGFADEDHSNDPLLSLYAAWKFAKGIQDA